MTNNKKMSATKKRKKVICVRENSVGLPEVQ